MLISQEKIVDNRYVDLYFYHNFDRHRYHYHY